MKTLSPRQLAFTICHHALLAAVVPGTVQAWGEARQFVEGAWTRPVAMWVGFGITFFAWAINLVRPLTTPAYRCWDGKLSSAWDFELVRYFVGWLAYNAIDTASVFTINSLWLGSSQPPLRLGILAAWAFAFSALIGKSPGWSYQDTQIADRYWLTLFNQVVCFYFAAVVNYSGRDLAVMCYLGISSTLLYCVRIISLYDLREENVRRLIGDLNWFEHWSGYQRECQGVHEFVSRIEEPPQVEWHQVEALSVVIRSLCKKHGDITFRGWGFHKFKMPNFNHCTLEVLEKEAIWLRYVLAWWHSRRGSMYMPSWKNVKVCLAWSLVSWPGLIACGLLADAVDTILVAAFLVFWQTLLLHLIVQIWWQENNLADLSPDRSPAKATESGTLDEFGGVPKMVLQYHLRVAANLTALLQSALRTHSLDCVPSFDYGIPYFRKSVMVSRQTNKIKAVVRLLYGSGDAISSQNDGARCLIGMWSMEDPPYKPGFVEDRATKLATTAATQEGGCCSHDCLQSQSFQSLVQLAVAVWTRVKILNEPEHNRASWIAENKVVVDHMEGHPFHSGSAVDWDAEAPWSRNGCPEVGETLHSLVCDIANMLQRLSLIEDEEEGEREEWMIVMALLMDQVWLMPKPLIIGSERVWKAVVDTYAPTQDQWHRLPEDPDLIFDGTAESNMIRSGGATLGFAEQVAHKDIQLNADDASKSLGRVASWLRKHSRHMEVAGLIWEKSPFIKLQ